MQAGFEARIALEDWANAAATAGNLSELYLALGDLPQAHKLAQQSVELADHSRDQFWKMAMRTSLADCYHQAGCIPEAVDVFHEAEVLQGGRQAEHPLLYSLWGFRYCDLLLSQGQFQEVQTRAARTLEWAKHRLGRFDMALDQLALGRAHLGLAQQADCSAPNMPAQHRAQAADWLQRAVDGFRQAGQQQYLPLGLLARAAWARVAQQFDYAHRDLAEARTIAERGEMRLHLADCHLERARLCLALGDRDTARQSHATAQKMVARMGYHRRDAELVELEAELTASE
jgi:tetratricopeptide (TPR) repeat protein